MVDRHPRARPQAVRRGLISPPTGPGRLAELPHGGVTDDKARFEEHVEPFTAAIVESFDDGSNRQFGLLALTNYVSYHRM